MPYDVIDLRSNRSTYTCQFITQTAHGFSVGEQVYLLPSGDYARAQADAQATLRVATVAEIISADRFVVGFEGRMPWPAHGLTVGAAYYLSGDVAGAITLGPPTNSTYFKQPVLVPINADEVRLLEFIISDGSTTTGGGLYQQVANLPTGPNWHRLGRLGGFGITEIFIQGISPGVGTSSFSITVGCGLVAGQDAGTNIRLNSRSSNSVFRNARLVVDGGFTFLEVLTLSSVNPYTIACTVAVDSSPRVGTGWVFDPAFQISPGGSPVAFLPADIDDQGAVGGAQWGVTDGAGNGMYLRNGSFRSRNPILMTTNQIKELAAPTEPNDAVRLIDLSTSTKLRGTILLADGATLTNSHQNWVSWQAPAAWAGQPIEITWNLELFRGAVSGNTFGWIWFNGGVAGNTFNEFAGYNLISGGNTRSRATWSASYVINSLNDTNLTMAVRLDNTNWQFGNSATDGRFSNAFARLVV